ncbi:metallophosphoesterase [Candidatus Pacearchaeota archaeon]|nr:metallophosphoesterase [Candidatus Pacearchaeota archaeon]
MKIAYATDLHGGKGLYERLFEEKADAVVIGGDILPNYVVGTEVGFETISNSEYFWLMAGNQRVFLEKYLVPRMERLKGKKEVYIMMGNDDFSCNLDILEDAERRGIVKLLYDKKKEKPKIHEISKDVFIAGYSYVPLTPFGIKDWEKFDRDEKPQRDCSFFGYKSSKNDKGCIISGVNLDTPACRKDTIAKDLENFVSDVGTERIEKMIVVIHSPPSNTVHDRAGFYEGWRHVGSIAIREFIEKYQPLLTLHGHIHESYSLTGEYKQNIGKTICVNPGTDKYNLYTVIFDPDNLSDMKIVVKKAKEIEEKPRGP